MTVVSELPSLLPRASLIVVNDTRVIPARIRAKKASGGSVELLVLEPGSRGTAVPCLARSSKPLRPGQRLQILAPGGEAIEVFADVLERHGTHALVVFSEDCATILDRAGEVPLPPYLGRRADPSDVESYQTLFAKSPGAVAAPTAGLHFTERLVEACAAAGHRIAKITLHVGPGTFFPVKVDDPREHVMHAERYVVSEETAARVNEARYRGETVVAVGTTVMRTLESAFSDGRVRSGAGETKLFILPGYEFQVVSALLTNFHLPRSTLFMLVSAFIGRERLLAAYADAITHRFRFYSYGDAMLIT